MDHTGPSNWPPGVYEKARAMWDDVQNRPVDIAFACGITADTLYNARRRYCWPDRGNVFHGRPMSAQELIDIERDWNADMSINDIAAKYRRGGDTISRLAEKNGWRARDAGRPPLAAGHPDMWALICQGTSLEGEAYPR